MGGESDFFASPPSIIAKFDLGKSLGMSAARWKRIWSICVKYREKREKELFPPCLPRRPPPCPSPERLHWLNQCSTVDPKFNWVLNSTSLVALLVYSDQLHYILLSLLAFGNSWARWNRRKWSLTRHWDLSGRRWTTRIFSSNRHFRSSSNFASRPNRLLPIPPLSSSKIQAWKIWKRLPSSIVDNDGKKKAEKGTFASAVQAFFAIVKSVLWTTTATTSAAVAAATAITTLSVCWASLTTSHYRTLAKLKTPETTENNEKKKRRNGSVGSDQCSSCCETVLPHPLSRFSLNTDRTE